MFAVRRIDERISLRNENFSMDSKGFEISDARKPDEDNVNLDKTKPDLSYELFIIRCYVFCFDKNEQCLLRQRLVKIIRSSLHEMANNPPYGLGQANMRE